MQIQDFVLLLLFLATVLFLLFSCKWSVAKYNHKWRIFYLVPVILCILHGIFTGVEWCLSGIYIGGLIMIAGYLWTTVSVRKKCAIVAMAFCILTVPVCFLSNNYRTASYLADFEDGFDLMKEHYSLSEHKKVDWDALYAKYHPLFEQVDKNQDAAQNFTTWIQFCNEFYDCHTTYVPNEDYDELKQSAIESVVGNDYGLSIVQLATGEYVAVSVEENSQAAQAGISTGTVITKWDGKAIEDWLPEALEREKKSMALGNVENQNFYQCLYLAGIGGEQVSVTFQNENGSEETVTLDAIGNYYKRFMDTYDCLIYKTPRENMSVVALNEDTILLNINMMAYNSAATESANYGSMQAAIREQLIAYREKGASNLIIDLRQNSGGSSMMAKAIVSLVAEGEVFWAADGTYNEETGKYEVLKDYTLTGENLWDGGKIIVLVNSASNSAANHLMAAIQKLDHVTVLGLTEPAGTAQGVGGIYLRHGIFSFSKTWVLDENGEIWVDSDETGHSRLMVDEKIPLTKEALVKMFDEKSDYVLDYAVEAFERN